MTRIINPPNIAVALHYDGESTPRVTAKGKGAVADQIIELARQNNIPLHTDAGLANVLAKIPLGDDIPRELYLAVAEVIAFAYSLSGKMPGK
ncbi:EscU/YscU/HrcU family type III secretion system export apparatus switch protein [Methylocaldum sp.]|uniref:EscU/YscU/HrcU family type III secretion system export apparatus switch protein n=1 Tax=Methylocaldum sp. TaxID=1969727 RepID=UPI002D75807B|nr:EscU/YscU/HrcU family type III secretion system export apparatus switch protein [Methylocaldum sp.]HYE34002.1 EscU/YscU/HrcU family type III secretion system export apparatus switch protein [Methylocaldum sp.]